MTAKTISAAAAVGFACFTLVGCVSEGDSYAGYRSYDRYDRSDWYRESRDRDRDHRRHHHRHDRDGRTANDPRPRDNDRFSMGDLRRMERDRSDRSERSDRDIILPERRGGRR